MVSVFMYTISVVGSSFTDLHVSLLGVACRSIVTRFHQTSLHDTEYGFRLDF